MINALELVSISDFALSIVCLFLAGLTLGNGKTNKLNIANNSQYIGNFTFSKYFNGIAKNTESSTCSKYVG